MTNNMRVACAALVLAFSVGSVATHAQDKPAQQYSGAEQAVLDSESKRLDAQVSRDTAVLGQAIADDAIYVHATGQMQTKAEYLHDVEAGNSKYRSIQTAERTVKVMGNMAIVHGMITLNVGVDRQINARYTGVYVMRDKRWQVLSFQTTPITQRQ